MKKPKKRVSAQRLSVFLSYRSVEARFADLLKQRLSRDFIGLVDVFLASDTTSIPAGASWHSELLDGLHRSGLHIVICSRPAVQCSWIHYEAGAAAVRGTPIVPLCHSGLQPDHLPFPLSETEGGVITDAVSIERLYRRVADLIGSGTPVVDFNVYAREFHEVERQLTELMECDGLGGDHGDRPPRDEDSELIQNPHVLCVTSRQFMELGYDNQLKLVLDAFPKGVNHNFVLNSAGLKRILREEHVDIVHIAAFVCPRAGDLYFTPVSLPLGAAVAGEVDKISPGELTQLLRKANTRLVVLGASASLVLGAQLITVANVIAVRDMVSAKAMAKWVETFYKRLREAPLADAFKSATEASQAPMCLYAQQRHAPSLKLQIPQPSASST